MILNLLQVPTARRAEPCVKCGHGGVAKRRRLVPLSNVDRTTGGGSQFERRLEIGMKSREPRIAYVAFEKHHIAKDALNVQHALEQVTLKLAAVFRCAHWTFVSADGVASASLVV